jgi:mono/diheme cytochrome c family protein
LRLLRLGITVFACVLHRAAPAADEIKLPDRSLYDFGRAVYVRNCMLCHGERGDGKGELSAELAPKPRSFVQGLFKYRSTPWGKLPTDADLKRTIRGGLDGTAMGSFTALTEDQIRAVAEYIKFFSRRWRHPENYAPPIEIPAQPPWLREETGLREHAASGKTFYEAACAVCHGPNGDGKGVGAVALQDDWGFPAVPADLRQPHRRSGSEVRDLYRVLMTGLNGTPMISFADVLTPEQKWDVIAYLRTLRHAAQ